MFSMSQLGGVTDTGSHAPMAGPPIRVTEMAPGANLIRSADYLPFIDVGDISPGSWLGRETLNVTVSIRRGLEVRRGPGLHGLVIGDADPILDIDRERG